MNILTLPLVTAGFSLALITPIHAGEIRSSEKLPPAVVDADYYDGGAPTSEKVELGRLLFFDKILSGNRNISCATCHHPKHGTSDGLALPFGEGPRGLGPDRKPGSTLKEAVHGRVPRNSPALFNLGAREFTRMFHDGRVETDPNGYYEGGFVTPAKWKLPKGLDNVLAAQAMFPPTSDGEMAGQKGENPVADAASLNNAAGAGGVWELLAKRLQNIPEYVERFQDAYPDKIKESEQITFVDAANAIAAFEATAFRSDTSRFDHFLSGEEQALSSTEHRGAELFYSTAGCADCHSGKFQTDHDFHAIAMPQIGPGKGDGQDGSYWRASGERGFLEDLGRGRVTVRKKDNYKFRTPSLRNVERTGPWGHAGSYDSLEDVVRHHLDPTAALENYLPSSQLLPPVGRVAEITATGSKLDHRWLGDSRLSSFRMRDTWVQNQPKLREKIAAANELERRTLTDVEVAEVVAFLKTLTDPTETEKSTLVPDRVPSGLPVTD
jgi:cytochrome c peroxidase